MNTTRGFTLIELMIVISIIGVLATMALPSYQDRVIRSQVREALGLAEMAKEGVEDYYISKGGDMPENNASAGLPEAGKIVGNYTSQVKVINGAIEVTLGNRINAHVENMVISLRPAIVAGEPRVPIAWVCGHASIPEKMMVAMENNTNLEPRLLPIECRY